MCIRDRHLGTTEYNSATLYRYATVNVAELAAHMSGEECGRVLRAFAEAFIRSMPTGKQNSFATVSYTHLDVYKRQEQYRVLPVDRCRSDGWQGTLSGAGETGACLLYTSIGRFQPPMWQPRWRSRWNSTPNETKCILATGSGIAFTGRRASCDGSSEPIRRWGCLHDILLHKKRGDKT